MSDAPKTPEPIKLDWIWHSGNITWMAIVPAVDDRAAGWLVIHAIQRPAYCDRGEWHVVVDTVDVFELDGQEGFPRYYFSLENLKDEMASWVNKRKCCLRARDDLAKAAPRNACAGPLD